MKAPRGPGPPRPGGGAGSKAGGGRVHAVRQGLVVAAAAFVLITIVRPAPGGRGHHYLELLEDTWEGAHGGAGGGGEAGGEAGGAPGPDPLAAAGGVEGGPAAGEATNSTGRRRRRPDKDMVIPRDGCAPIVAKYQVSDAGQISEVRIYNATKTTHIAKYSRDYRYMHMAMIETVVLPNGRSRLVAAWQAAPAEVAIPLPGGKLKQRMAVEGLPAQRIQWAFSDDNGASWSNPNTLADPDEATRPAWGPVLHFDMSSKRLWLFYALSQRCEKKAALDTKAYEPGGDIKARAMDITGRTMKWGKAKTLLTEASDQIPKVTANKLVVLHSGEWVLPFWREQPTLKEGQAQESRVCAVPPGVEGRAENVTAGEEAPRTSAGVLISTNQGRTWTPHGVLTHAKTPLIEGTVVEIGAPADAVLLMFFRSMTGCVFRTTSEDKGRTWTDPMPVGLPNPNTKFSVMKLSRMSMDTNQDILVMALNNHRKGEANCPDCRTHLNLIASSNSGDSWQKIGTLEEEHTPGVRLHYPTMTQNGHTLHVVYSKFYIGKYELVACKTGKTPTPCHGLESTDQGIKYASFNIKKLMAKVAEPDPKPGTLPMTQEIFDRMVDHFMTRKAYEMDLLTGEGKIAAIKKLRESSWGRISGILSSEYDLSRYGGMRKLKKNAAASRGDFASRFRGQITETLRRVWGRGSISIIDAPLKECGCHVHDQATGMRLPCPCSCRQYSNCIVLCLLNSAGCLPLPAVGYAEEDRTKARRTRRSGVPGGSSKNAAAPKHLAIK